MEGMFENAVREVVAILIPEGSFAREQRINDAVNTIVVAHNLTSGG